MTKLALSGFAFAAVLHADFHSADWRFRRALRVQTPAPISKAKLDLATYRGSAAQLADLRIIRDGTETPYVIEALNGASEQKELQPAVLNKSARPGTGVELTLDLGGPALHNRLRITTPERNFKQRVRIETSDDGRRWAIARDDGYIFDFSQGDRNVSVLTVHYPVSSRRFVRATVFGWDNPKSIASAVLTYRLERSERREAFAAFDKPAAIQDTNSQSTLYTIDLGFEGLPHDQLQLDVAPGLFYRPVEIETSADGKAWIYAGQGVISRTPQQEQLSVPHTEVWERYLRLRIMNRDDQPLDVRRIAVSTITRYVNFPGASAGQYWLYYGNADAKHPAYDLAQAVGDTASGTVVSLEAQQENPDYRAKPPAPKPWSDRHTGLMYSVLGAAILVMGYVTVRFLLKVASKPTEPS